MPNGAGVADTLRDIGAELIGWVAIALGCGNG
jgi:hypothetical protein